LLETPYCRRQKSLPANLTCASVWDTAEMTKVCLASDNYPSWSSTWASKLLPGTSRIWGDTTWILGYWLKLCFLHLVGEEELHHHWINWDVLWQLTQLEYCDGRLPGLQDRQAGRQGGVGVYIWWSSCDVWSSSMSQTVGWVRACGSGQGWIISNSDSLVGVC